jgi:hypothetical protein
MFEKSEGECANIVILSYSHNRIDIVTSIIQIITFPVCMDIAIFSYSQIYVFSFLHYHY